MRGEKEHTVSRRQALACSQQLSSMLWQKRDRGREREERKVGCHSPKMTEVAHTTKRLTSRKRERQERAKKKIFDFISKHWFQFSSRFSFKLCQQAITLRRPQTRLCCGWLTQPPGPFVKAFNMALRLHSPPLLSSHPQKEQILSFPTMPLGRHILLGPI